LYSDELLNETRFKNLDHNQKTAYKYLRFELHIAPTAPNLLPPTAPNHLPLTAFIFINPVFKGALQNSDLDAQVSNSVCPILW
jgi:hypothetical protein